ncbi:MAG: ATP phosphoribosyltransferase regulatory subunit [Sulfuricella sp.]|nr:ATP phosphoribosyltransferase regulatory subunit [Sulfuricella sp.]
MTTHNWLLPENVEDILPAQAWYIETLRRRLLDLFHGHGYQLIVPPLLEYLPSLLTGSGYDMDTKTFKLVDQLSGRMMGLRADITPQAARIDAHLLNRQGVVRLCYAASVVHTLPDGLMKTREPLQVGVELFGHGGIEADVEVQQMMLDVLEIAGVKQVHLDLGHVGIFRSLMKNGNVSPELEAGLFGALQGKDSAVLVELSQSLAQPIREALCLLPTLYGEVTILEEARRKLPDYPEITEALDDLANIAGQLQGRVVRLCVDLAELRGYHYHSGVVFAAYSEGWANAIAQGGRYDEVGRVFGRSRPATGFSLDLRNLCEGLPVPGLAPSILAPYIQDKVLRDTINTLRAQGETVVVDLPGHEAQQGELDCDRRLVKRDGSWHVEII